MVFIIARYGQNSNRLLQDMRIKTFCRKHGIFCQNLDFEDLEEYFNFPRTSKLRRFLNKVIRCLFKMWKKYFFDLTIHLDYPYQEKYFQQIRRFGIHFIDGWGLYDLEEEANQLPQNRALYRLAPRFFRDDPLYKQFSNWKKEGFTLVGVHIRRGDYKLWGDGKYFYDDDVYARLISRMRTLLAGKKLKFLIFSSDTCDIEGEDIVISHAPWYIDQLLLGLSDYSFGPPSSFRQWGAYIYAEGLTCDIFDPDKTLELSDFKPFDNWENIPGWNNNEKIGTSAGTVST